MLGRNLVFALAGLFATACSPAASTGAGHSAIELETAPGQDGAPATHRLSATVKHGDTAWAGLMAKAGEVCGERKLVLVGIRQATGDGPGENSMSFECHDATLPNRTAIATGAEPVFPEPPAGTQRTVAWTTVGRGLTEHAAYASMLGSLMRDLYVKSCAGQGLVIQQLASAVEGRPDGASEAPKVHVAIDYRCTASPTPAT